MVTFNMSCTMALFWNSSLTMTILLVCFWLHRFTITTVFSLFALIALFRFVTCSRRIAGGKSPTTIITLLRVRGQLQGASENMPILVYAVDTEQKFSRKVTSGSTFASGY